MDEIKCQAESYETKMTIHGKLILPKIWLWLGRLFYLALFAGGLYLITAVMPQALDSESYICTQKVCGFETVLPSELQPLAGFGITPEIYVNYRFWTDTPAILFLFLGVSLLIFLLRSDEWIGLLSATFLLTFPIAMLTGDFTSTAAYFSLPGWLTPLVYGFSTLFAVIGGASLVVLFYVFPDGKFVPGWTRWLALAVLVNSVGIRVFQLLAPALENQSSVTFIPNLVYFLLLVLAFTSQIYRYRRISTPTQRQQTKWVIVAVILMPLCDLVIRGLLNVLLPWANHPGPGRVIHYMITIPLLRTIPFMLVPISFAFAIFRFRLWDIDIIIRRTLQYSLLTAVLAGIYLMSIVLLQAVFNTIGREQTALVTVLSTLMIAALFNPLRRRIQAIIDRRFFRQKYNAEKSLAEFAAVVRNETNLEALTIYVVEIVSKTMQPEQINLWLAPQRKK